MNDKWMNGKRKVNAFWTQGERFVSAEREWSGAESAGERNLDVRWTHCERTVRANETKDKGQKIKVKNERQRFASQTEKQITSKQKCKHMFTHCRIMFKHP